MVGKLILSHGDLAAELLRATETIAGKADGFVALSVPWEQDCSTVEGLIRNAVEALDQGDGVLILVDMFGDTPCNLARALLRPGKVEIVTGINLPLIVRLACAPGAPPTLHELAQWAVGKAQGGVRLLDQPPQADGVDHG